MLQSVMFAKKRGIFIFLSSVLKNNIKFIKHILQLARTTSYDDHSKQRALFKERPYF